MIHNPSCEGWHTTDISCVAATELREQARRDPYWCPPSRTGYHGFDNIEHAEDTCVHGCGTRQGDLL